MKKTMNESAKVSAASDGVPTVKKGAKKKAKKRKKKQQPSPQEKEQSLQKKEIRNLMANIGLSRFQYIDGKEFVYDSRKSELDDIFYYENIIVLTEYTVGAPGVHLLKKKIIYDKINNDPQKFLQFLMSEDRFKSFADAMNRAVLNNYSFNQLQVRILYASKTLIEDEHRNVVDGVIYFDYSTVKYFEGISKIIKRSTKYEFFDFLQIEFPRIGENVKKTTTATVDHFSGHILPEEHSSFKNGYKIISFYIDAESLIKRAYVLRNEGWKNKDKIGLYQRMFLMKKIKGMRKYLHEKKRVFINNIIVTLPSNRIKLTDENGNDIKIDSKGNFKGINSTTVMPASIKIDNGSNIIGIIDGQHRCYSYHEGDDIYEATIAKLRGIQNLLVTGILYPKDEDENRRLKFEAELFLEINSNQTGASSKLKQEIEYMMNAFSTTSISKHIVNQLNKSGPLSSLFEEYWYEKSKLKTASIISFGLKPVVKFEGDDTLFKIWKHSSKNNLQQKNDYNVLNAYKEFCTVEIRNIFRGLKANIEPENWRVDRTNKNAILNVTTINGVINCLRLLIEEGKQGNVEYYTEQFKKIKGFNFKSFKSSQYRRMGEAIYKRCFQ